MTDERSYIERSQSMAQKLHGRYATTHEMASEFATYDLLRRAQSLDAIDGELNNDNMSIRQRAEMFAKRRKLNDVHEALRGAGR